MKNRLKIVIICSILIISNKYLFSQTLSDLHFEKFNKVFPKKSVKKINWYTSKKSNIQKNRLKRYDKSQIRLFKKLCKINPSQADALYLNWALSKRKLNDEFRNTNYKGDNVRYNSMHDSLVNVVSFIDHKDNFKNGSSSSSIKDNLKSALDKENALNNYFRNQTSLMKKVTMEHPELSKDFINLNKNSFYFLQENKYVDDYFSSLRCIKKELIENISHQVGFKDYFSVNSFLAGKFSPPENWGSSTKNLQTVQSVKHEEQIAYNHLSSELKKEIPTNILDGKNKIAKIKSKYPQVKNISELPSFKPNTLKGKPFQSRIHTGFDF